MPAGTVYFSDLRASARENLTAKLSRLMDMAGIGLVVKPRALVAVKLHFGEKGNTAFIRPVFLRRIVDHVKQLGGLPFLTDTNTLYAGTRGESVSHVTTAIENGFAYAVVNAPVIIADGIRGASFSEVRIEKGHVQAAYVGKEIAEADALISVAHFKGHELTGFGGTIKNVGMGCASRKGKLAQHSELSPKVKRKKCAGCGECAAHCSQDAISVNEGKAFIDPKRCVGCSECILICTMGAIDVRWSKDVPTFQKKMAEYAYAVLRGKEGRALFINFLTHIAPECDCYGHTDAAIVPDAGILASRDPVAIDQASVDIVNRLEAAPQSALQHSRKPGQDKFKGLYPKIEWRTQLEHAESLGLGTRDYELVPI